MSDYQEVRGADAEARQARIQMLATVGELKDRLRPKTLLARAMDRVVAKGRSADGAGFNRTAAMATGGILVSGALLARRHLKRRAVSRDDATGGKSKS